MGVTKIERGDPQPIPCEKCGMEGYQFSDNIAIGFATALNSDGKLIQSGYSDYVRIINEGVTPYCANCGGRLKFKLVK